jgi:proteasome lid subunit RPN8/RPN11
MTDVKFGSWSVPESPVSIEYSLVVIEEIRREVSEGFQRLARGGIEVGGILYGTREGRNVRVEAVRPIECEHARGPSFQLSDKDKTALEEQLAQDRNDPRLEGLITVGWYLSHTRSEIGLSDSDLEIYARFFPAPWQVAFVIRPGRGGSMRGGFFVREPDGTVKGERSYLEFNFPDRLAGVLDRTLDRPAEPPAERPPRDRVDRRALTVTRGLSVAREPAIVPQAIAEPLPQFLQTPPPSRRKWPWLVVWAVVVLAAAVAGLRYWMPQPVEPVSLAVIEREGQLQISWNHAASAVANAKAGSLEIADGPGVRKIPLSREVLSTGKFTYARKTGDVEIRFTVESPLGTEVQEASRFLGRAPVADMSSEEVKSLEERRTELEAEVKKLRREKDAEASRIQQLERTLRILQTRLGIDQGNQGK